MNSKFKITIPKPCHENWNTMTPKEKGRFCSSCAKTVIDFTKKTTEEIQEYLVDNKNQQVCGHFYKKQLDTITIEIPQVAFQQQLSFQKLFVLALLFVMGTTLFSCQYSDGEKQKIENVIVKDSIKKTKNIIDTLKIKEPKELTGETIIIGLPVLPPLTDSTTVEGKMIVEPTWCPSPEKEERQDNFPFFIIENPPRFKEAKNFSKEEAIKHFNKNMFNFVQKNFDKKLTQYLDLREGKHKMYAQFTIDEKGNTLDIKVKAPHKTLEKEAKRLVNLLPQFIPGKQKGKPVKTKYTLPITFYVE